MTPDIYHTANIYSSVHYANSVIPEAAIF